MSESTDTTTETTEGPGTGETLDLTSRGGRAATRMDLFDQLDRLFDQWTGGFPFRRPATAGSAWSQAQMIPVDQFREDEGLVIRAELPGIDPEKDVEVTVTDGMLRIEAERREEERSEEEGYVRRELRTGAFARILPLPDGVTEDDIKATYENGILEIHVPIPAPSPARKVPVSRA